MNIIARCSYDVLKTTPFGHEADCNAGSGSSTAIFLCYKRSLTNLEPLRVDTNDSASFPHAGAIGVEMATSSSDMRSQSDDVLEEEDESIAT